MGDVARIERTTIFRISGLLEGMTEGKMPELMSQMERAIFLLDADNLNHLALRLGHGTRLGFDELQESWAAMEPLLMAAATDGRLHWLGAEPTLEGLNQALEAHGLPTIPWEVVDRICGAVHVDCLHLYMAEAVQLRA